MFSTRSWCEAVCDPGGHHAFYGRGAGMMPTASAIVSDLVDAARGSARQSFTKLPVFPESAARYLPFDSDAENASRYYVRFRVAASPARWAISRPSSARTVFRSHQ